MKNQKILFLAHNYFDAKHAGAIRVNSMISFLSKKYDSYVITLSRKFGYKCGNRVLNLPFATPETDVPFIRFINIFNILMYFIAGLIVKSLWKYDLILVSSPPGSSVFAAYILSKITKSKLFIDVRDDWESYFIHYSQLKIEKSFGHFVRKLNSYIYAKAHCVSSVTLTLTSIISNRANRVDIITVYNGITLAEFEELTENHTSKNSYCKAESEMSFIFIGHEISYYRLDVLIKAFLNAAKKNGNLRLLLVGGLKNKYAQSDNITYMGKVNHDRALLLLAASDVSCIPFDDLGMFASALPAKILESFLLGKPVLYTGPSDSEIGRILSKYNNGIASKLDEFSLSNSILHLSDKKDFFRKNALIFSKIAIRKYIREDNYQKISSAIEKILTS